MASTRHYAYFKSLCTNFVTITRFNMSQDLHLKICLYFECHTRISLEDKNHTPAAELEMN